MADIHSTAVISRRARIGESVRIGPYAVIGDEVLIDEGTEVGAHVMIGPWTHVGRHNEIHTGAVVGTDSQDLKYKGGRTFCRIGDHNIIREYVTINRSTIPEEATVIGDHNVIQAYCHVAHDCILGSHISIRNLATLAGHVVIEDGVDIGSYVGVHQFCRIGRLSHVGDGSKVVKDVPPYVRVAGSPVLVEGLNLDTLESLRLEPDSIAALQRAFDVLYRSNNNVSQAIEVIEQTLEPIPEICDLLEFLRASQRGICKNADASGSAQE